MATKNPKTISKAPQREAPAAKAKASQAAQSVPRSLAGVVGKKGEILDQDGNVIGRLPSNKNLAKVSGHNVTATGDILDSSGDEVLGKANLTEDFSEYTTQPAQQAAAKAKPALGKGKGVAQPGQQAAKAQETAQQAPQAAKGKGAEGLKKGQAVPDRTKPAAKAPQAPQAAAGAQKKISEGVSKAKQQPPTAQAAPKVPQKAPKQAPAAPTPLGKKKPMGAKPPAAQAQAPEEPVGEEEPPEADTEQATGAAEGAMGEEALGEEGEEEEGEEEEGEEEAEEGEEEEGVEGEELEVAEEDVELEGEELEGEEEEGLEGVEGEEGEAEVEGGVELEEGEEELDFTILKDSTINKAGNLVNEDGNVVGRLVEGDPKKLAGKKSDEEGHIWDDSGNVIGVAEPLPPSELEGFEELAPFENYPDAKVEADGRVTSDGLQVGIVVEGDPKRLRGSAVDADGDILDRRGNVAGRAEAWNEPEEAEIDNSILAGKKVNKAGNVVDEQGSVFGRVIEGNVNAMVGHFCDKEGNVLSETGEPMGKAEAIPEEEREKLKVGPFEDLADATVAKDGTIVTPAGDVVGRLVEGDPKELFGRTVDAEGDILDSSGNVLGRAERYTPEEVINPLAGRKVNQEGNVVDDDGNVIGKLTSGDLGVCAGKEVDNDNDVVNAKGDVLGHVTAIEDIPQETEEERKAREQEEQDRKLAEDIAGCIEDGIERIRPILKMIVGKIEAAENTPEEDLDEDQLVREVKPLIEEGGQILTELNGAIRGLDPDGRIQRNAKHKAGTKDASPEEYYLADQLNELSTTVTDVIDEAKARLEGMPHAKEELDPLFGLLTDPLGQIIAAVGLLLSGVLGLVGKLTGSLGVGNILGSVTGGLGGGGGKKKKGGGGGGGPGGLIAGLGGGAIGGIIGGGGKK